MKQHTRLILQSAAVVLLGVASLVAGPRIAGAAPVGGPFCLTDCCVCLDWPQYTCDNGNDACFWGCDGGIMLSCDDMGSFDCPDHSDILVQCST
jgi:hypothetical protein